ncbi:Bromodomain and PHD finger-containing protein 3 [Ananas comosus]|uniref:Bromodomain and PHD finger-containing protein 3 n=1 Tax=Ananas comosus TaxID=4615 RepID=A0A199UJI5_ANACO|nr:Bromodomain and PHD finger-containing protein 3 [Ananas comosus]
MDFGTIRKKLSDGAYVNLEQFERDVFLISSNAMHYNAPDTIYYQQARSIRDLAKKNFENLREKGDSNEPTQKTLVRRGRPPKKIKQTVSRPSDCAFSEFNNSDATLANSGDSSRLSNFDNDLSRKELAVGNSMNTNKSMRTPYSLCSTETFGWLGEQKQSKNKEYLGIFL